MGFGKKNRVPWTDERRARFNEVIKRKVLGILANNENPMTIAQIGEGRRVGAGVDLILLLNAMARDGTVTGRGHWEITDAGRSMLNKETRQ